MVKPSIQPPLSSIPHRRRSKRKVNFAATRFSKRRQALVQQDHTVYGNDYGILPSGELHNRCCCRRFLFLYIYIYIYIYDLTCVTFFFVVYIRLIHSEGIRASRPGAVGICLRLPVTGQW
jgi:hypothetical protein